MKFEEAFDQAFEKEKQRAALVEEKFIVTQATAKTLAFMWNILAIAQKELDDTVYINKNNEIVSVPLKEKEQKSSPKTAPKKDKAVKKDGKKEKKTATESSGQQPT